MKAAVITSFSQPPCYGDFPDPMPRGPEEELVDVLAVGLHHVTRGRASGDHYSSTGELPGVAGVDGVGRDGDGRLRYFVQEPGQTGTMAEKTVIRRDHSIVLPDDCDPVVIAGQMNPAMASWLALRCRVPFGWGQKVLILGATGGSGNMAVQICRHLGASQIIAAGRDRDKLVKLQALGATDMVALGDEKLGLVASEVDIVLDFIWGDTAVQVMEAMLRQRSDRSQLLTWIHIGSMAGELAGIRGAFLRASNFHIVGSGHGALSAQDILTELPQLVRELADGNFHISMKTTPLHDVEQVWSVTARSGERIVFTP